MKKKNVFIASAILVLAAAATATAIYLSRTLQDKKELEADNARTKALQGLGYLK
jgi:hypothetical protein